jgi:predicted amidohydrolase
MRIARAQIGSTADVAENLHRIEVAACRAVADRAALLCLPEAATYRGPFDPAVVQPRNGPVVQQLCDIARTHGIHLAVGGMWTDSGDPRRPFNTQLVIDPLGAVLAAYHKIHLFRLDDPDCTEDESACTTAGDDLVTVDIGGVRIGLSICYDLRFPELYRALADRGAIVLLVPSNFSHVTGPAHWEPLLRARAVENLCYVLAPAQIGSDATGFTAHGHTMAVDPWGGVLADAGGAGEQLTVDVDAAVVWQCRARLRSPQHRRPDVYGGSPLPDLAADHG